MDKAEIRTYISWLLFQGLFPTELYCFPLCSVEFFPGSCCILEPYAAALTSVGNPPSILKQLFLSVFKWFSFTWTVYVPKEKPEALRTNSNNRVTNIVHPTEGLTALPWGALKTVPWTPALSKWNKRRLIFPDSSPYLISSHLILVGFRRLEEMFLVRARKGRKLCSSWLSGMPFWCFLNECDYQLLAMISFKIHEWD